MACDNCGKTETNVIVDVRRYRDEGDAYRNEGWCLECMQGKNPVKGYK